MNPLAADHLKISLGGLAAGLALGIGLVIFLEGKDHTLGNENDLRRYFVFPLMVGLLALPTRAEERRRSRLAALEWFAGVTLCLLVCATEYYVYRRG
jgi:hypothetical protein